MASKYDETDAAWDEMRLSMSQLFARLADGRPLRFVFRSETYEVPVEGPAALEAAGDTLTCIRVRDIEPVQFSGEDGRAALAAVAATAARHRLAVVKRACMIARARIKAADESLTDEERQAARGEFDKRGTAFGSVGRALGKRL